MPQSNTLNINQSMFVDLSSPGVGGAIFLDSSSVSFILKNCLFSICSAFGVYEGISRGYGSGGACFIEAKSIRLSFSIFCECFSVKLGSSVFLFTAKNSETKFECNSDSKGKSNAISTCGIALERTSSTVSHFNSSNPDVNFRFGMFHIVLSTSSWIRHSLFIGGKQEVQSAMDISDDREDTIDITDCVVTDTKCEQAPITAPRSTVCLKDSFFVRCTGQFPTNYGTFSLVSGCYYSDTLTLNKTHANVMKNNHIYSNEKYNIPSCKHAIFLRCSNSDPISRFNPLLAFSLISPYL